MCHVLLISMGGLPFPEQKWEEEWIRGQGQRDKKERKIVRGRRQGGEEFGIL